MGQGSIGNLYVKVSGKEINFASLIPSLVEHPGNIDSGGNNAGCFPDGGTSPWRLFPWDRAIVELGASWMGQPYSGQKLWWARCLSGMGFLSTISGLVVPIGRI